MIRYVGVIADNLEHCTICGGNAWKYVAIEVYNYNEYTNKRMCAPNKNMYVCKDYEVVVENMAKGRIDSKKMVSKIYSIEEFTAAMEMADKSNEPVVKVMLKF